MGRNGISIRRTGAALLIAVLLPNCQLGSQTAQAPPLVELVSKASFVFRGTVRQLHASTPSIPTEDRTAIVHVDEVIEAIEMPGYQGKDVTVRLLNPAATPAGSQWTFFTEPYSFGHTTGVVEIKSLPVAERAALLKQIQAAREELYDRTVAKRLAGAEVVVVAKVAAVEPSQEAKRERESDSEHNPLWQRATLQVETALKGKPSNQLAVFFASSRDAMWVRTPKLKAGEEGIFLLQRFDFPFFQPEGLVVVDPLDAQSKTQTDRVKRLLGVKQ